MRSTPLSQFFRSLPGSRRCSPIPASTTATIASRSNGIKRLIAGKERTEVFQKHALALLEQVALEATARAGLELRDIDAFVTNTITGLAIPSLDALLMNRLDFAPSVERLPIFGLGCGGGVAGLARAARFAQGRPGANVLFITVDLCSLCARPNDPSMAMFVSAALFGDGAAGVVLRTAENGDGSGEGAKPRIEAFGEHLWRDTPTRSWAGHQGRRGRTSAEP